MTSEVVSIVGLGVIGGSVARALARAGAAVRTYAADASDRDAARRVGIDVANDLAGCVARAPVVLIAVPVHVHAAAATAVVATADRDAVVLHAASLQRPSALGAAADGRGTYDREVAIRVVGTHPIAGSHRSGFAASDEALFIGSVVSIETRADRRTRSAAEKLWRTVGVDRFEYRSADEHDELMIWASHLPQLASTALANALASAGLDATALGPGGRDATRLAASPFELWAGILRGARPGVAHAAAALERSVGALRAALEDGDMDRLGSAWRAAAVWRSSAERDTPPPAAR